MSDYLHKKLMESEPGRYANAIGDALYYHGDRIGKDAVVALQAARAYLEKLALDELAHPWVREFVERLERGDG